MRILEKSLTIGELKTIAEGSFGDLVKAVVDVDRELMALDAELHSDLEALLLGNGSSLEDLWGINLYPDLHGDDFVEFDSIINVRPSLGNASRRVDDERIRQKVLEIVNRLVRR